MASQAERPVPARATTLLSHLPLSFEQNTGQFDSATRFFSRGPGFSLILTANRAVLSTREETLNMVLAGSEVSVVTAAEHPLSGTSNYFKGQPSAWRTNVAQLEQVRYRDVYPNTDLIYHGTNGQLEFDFELRPGAELAKDVSQRTSPVAGWEWRGPSDLGSWYIPTTFESLHPHPTDLGHKSHWDYVGKNGNEFRKYPSGECEPKDAPVK